MIVTDKCNIAFTADELLTLKDIIDRLNNGEILIEAIRYTAGADTERKWTLPDGSLMGRSAVKFANAHVRKFTVEKGQSHLRNIIFSSLPAWRDRAAGKRLSAPIKEMAKKSNGNGKVDHSSDRDKMLAEAEKYMEKLKDAAEIGSMYKFMRYLKKQK